MVKGGWGNFPRFGHEEKEKNQQHQKLYGGGRWQGGQGLFGKLTKFHQFWNMKLSLSILCEFHSPSQRISKRPQAMLSVEYRVAVLTFKDLPPTSQNIF